MAYNKTRKFNVTIVQLPTASTVKVYYLAAADPHLAKLAGNGAGGNIFVSQGQI